MIDGILQGDTANTELGTVIYNNTLYDFKLMLVNPEGSVFIFKTSSIKDLSIDDTINNYFQSGYMVVKNDFDLMERPAPASSANGSTGVSSPPPANYIFRGDSRDILRVSITPKLDQNSLSETSEKTQNMMSIVYDFVIYDMEEIPGDAPSVKFKKLYFWDLYHQVLREKKINFSTAKLPSNVYRNQNIPGAVSTGAAMQELLKAVFPDSEGFTNGFGKFDAGGTDIFFSSPAGYSAHDCLMYLLSKHVSTTSNNFDKCLLSIERSPKAWTLTSITDLYNAAYDSSNDAGGILFLERLLLGGFKENDPNILTQNVSRTPAISVYMSDVGTVQNFSFVSSPGHLTQDKVKTSIAHAYNFKTKDFYVDTGSNSFVTQQDVYYKNYVKSMLGENGVPSSNLIGNIYRLGNQNVNNVFSTSYISKEQRYGVARNDSLFNAVMLNNTITLTLPGATYRQSGKFIAIERTDATNSSKFDDKLLGIYLIVQVKHMFTETEYTNEITAVKTYNYRSLGQTQAII